MGFIFGLLGIGKSIWNFVLRNWKWAVPLIAAVALLFYVNHNAYNRGVQDMVDKQKKEIAAEDVRNRKFEKKLQDAVNQFGERFEKEDVGRVEKETIHTNSIQTIIKDNPIYKDCKVDPKVLDEINSISDLGPKP